MPIDSEDPGEDDPISVTRAASEWVVRKDRGMTAEEAMAFARWKEADPARAAEWRRIERQWRSMDRLGSLPALAALAAAAESGARARRARRRWVLAGAMAAGLAAAAALAVHGRATTRHGGGRGAGYRLIASTAHRLLLTDGSVTELNGDSGVVPHFVPGERRVTLVRGEALFHVAKNPARPFVVYAGPMAVRAVGTAFDVRLGPGVASVLVTEGRVALIVPAGKAAAVRTLGAGERAVVRRTDGDNATVAVDRPRPLEIDGTLAWESDRLVFDRTPLGEVVKAFNRFNTRKLTLADRKLETRTLTGTFRADNLDGFVRLLRASADVVAREDGGRVLLLSPAGPGP